MAKTAAVSQPRLTISILTTNSATRLPRLLDEVSCFADEIVVGVDAASTDETLEIASDLADRVYRFNHPPGQLAAARMLIFRYATGDWILSLDDDESISDSFDELLPTLIQDPGLTHYWFTRQWIVDRDPFRYLSAPPWFPDWQLRLFRNDASLVWKPPRAHSGYYVQGHGRCEPGIAIHHFERLVVDPEERERKLARYRLAGSVEESERQFRSIPSETPRARATQRTRIAPRPREQALAVVDRDVHDPPVKATAPWGCKILQVDMGARLRPGEEFVAEVVARNIGMQAWTPDNWARRAPQVYLSYHLTTAAGEMVQFDNKRHAVPDLVRPGRTTIFLVTAEAPSLPGTYVLNWDMVSEGEVWFAELGSSTFASHIEVV